MENQGQRTVCRVCTTPVMVVLLCIIMLTPSVSLGFDVYRENDWEISLDSLVSWGLKYRAEDRDDGIVGIANDGKAYSVNYDDGNLNYDKGQLVSNAVKITSELDIKYRRFGTFVRGSAFYDFQVMDGDTERTALSDEAEDAIGRDAELLDAYIWGEFDLGDVPVQVRVGDQVVNWGESTFIMGGINYANPVDVSKIRVPGAQLKEALIPEGMVWASAGVTDLIDIEGMYIYDWVETKIDAPGTFFSAADFAGPGGFKLLLGYGRLPDGGNASVANTLGAAPRDPDNSAKDDGQFGAAVRAQVPALNDTEFGFFYLHYHDRGPRLSVRTGTDQGVLDAIAAAPGGATAILDAYFKTAGYYLDYVEDRDLYGLSFSTELFGFGWQGEVSYRPDAAIQIDDAELLLAMFGPLGATFGGPFAALAGYSQLPAAGTNEILKGYIERDMYQVQTTFSRLLNPGFLGYDSGVILGEIGWVHVDNMPGKNELRMEGAGTYTPGNPDAAAINSVPASAADGFADADSWGYRLLFKLNYFNAIGPITLSPRLVWSHDVDGNSPYGGPFLKDRQAVTPGLTAQYQSWTADVSYTSYFGNEERNLRHDRDYIGFNIKYSF